VTDASWVEGAEGSGFGLAHLPYGVFSRGGEPPRVGVAIGAHVLDLSVALGDAWFDQPRLNPFLAAGPPAWASTRARLQELLGPDAAPRPELLIPRGAVRMHLPFEVADYVDFYSSIEHATNVGRLFRPDTDPLLPNWRHLPVGYHGRAGTVVVSGTPIRRPSGQRKPPNTSAPTFGPSHSLDIELEVGWVTGPPSALGEPVPIDRVGDHVFGLVLVNDWSARDIQAWEYQPLGPFLGKSFATSIAAWITPLAALEPFRRLGPPQNPPVLDYLRTRQPWAFDLDLEAVLNGEVITRVNFSRMYWNVAQQLAHATVNGATIRTGDLYASGTVSGPTPGTEGSLLEQGRPFLADGDAVTLRGRAGPLTLGEVTGTILPTLSGRQRAGT
jgi:fumarylacetoacetase